MLSACFTQSVKSEYSSLFEGYGLGLISYDMKVIDFQGDGFPDVVISNGNDQMVQPLVIYRPTATSGQSPKYPAWVSENSQFGMGMAIADFDGDGANDIAVAISKGGNTQDADGGVHIYYANRSTNHTPYTFSLLPSEIIGFSATDVEAADVDGDGYLDLVVAENAQTSQNEKHDFRVVLSSGGVFKQPTWASNGSGAYKLILADVDDDGSLDVITIGPSLSVRFGRAPQVGVVPFNKEADWSVKLGNVAFGGDLVRLQKGLGILVASDKGIELYAPLRNDSGSNTPTWSDTSAKNVIAVKVMEIDVTGRQGFFANEYTHTVSNPKIDCPYPGAQQGPDHCLGGHIRFYRGDKKGSFVRDAARPFPELPTTITQAMATTSLYLIDKKKQNKTWKIKTSTHRTVFTLPDNYVESIQEVKVDGKTLLPMTSQNLAGYTFSAGHAWFSVSGSVPENTTIEVTYVTAVDLDVAIAPALSGIGLHTYMLQSQ